jgi:hypothetical protein
MGICRTSPVVFPGIPDQDHSKLLVDYIFNTPEEQRRVVGSMGRTRAATKCLQMLLSKQQKRQREARLLAAVRSKMSAVDAESKVTIGLSTKG